MMKSRAKFYAPFFLTAAALVLSECKSFNGSGSDLETIRGSDVEDGDPSLYVLDERNYDGSDLRTLTVLRLECGGDERFLKGKVDDLAARCLNVASISLYDLIETQYVPYFQNLNNATRLGLSQQDFLLYLVKSLRAFPARLDSLQIVIPEISSARINVGNANPPYTEAFANFLPKLADFMSYDSARVRSAPSLSRGGVALENPTGVWIEQFLRLDQASPDALSQLNLTANSNTSNCPVGLVSARLADSKGHWTTLRRSGGGLDTDGYYTRYKLQIPNAGNSFQYARLLWRYLGDARIACKVSFASSGGWRDDPVPGTDPVPPTSGTPTLTRAQKFYQVSQTFAAVGHRLHHLLWHSIRNGWNRPGTSDYDRQLMAGAVPGEDWRPSRPLIYGPSGTVDIVMTEQLSPGAGEDFFHMHREMVKIAKSILGGDFVVVPNTTVLIRERERMIAEGLIQRIPIRNMQEFQQQLAAIRLTEQGMDALDLSRMTLGQLGTQLEWTLHNNLHERFARPAGEILLLNATNPWSMQNFFAPQMPWNQPSYQHLGDPYASASNPLFWLIHSYVDQWIDRWLQAQRYGEISDNCSGRSGCYQWLQNVRGTPWDGGSSVDHAHQMRVAALPPELARSLVNMSTFITR